MAATRTIGKQPMGYAERSVIAGRAARFTFAKRRIEYIRDAEPRFTPEQIEQLVAVLRGEAR